MIKPQDLAAIKTTGEVVFVLKIGGLLKRRDIVTVRRPNVSQNWGVSHQTETFTLAELETTDEVEIRKAEAQALAQQRFMSMMGKSDEPNEAKLSPILN